MKLKKLTKWMATLLSVICCQATFAEIKINAWYPKGDAATYIIDSTFSCGKYAKISGSYSEWPAAQFQIQTENGTTVPHSDIDITTYNSNKFTFSKFLNGNDEALKIDFTNGSDPDRQQVWSTSFVVDLSGKPYKIYSEIPEYRSAMAEADLGGAKELTTPGQNFALIASFCSNPTLSSTTYIWETSDNGTDWAPMGYTTQTIPSHTQGTDTSYYRVIATTILDDVDDNGDPVVIATYKDTSKAVMVRYKMPTVKLTASAADNTTKTFTSSEFEVEENTGQVNFRAVPTGFDGAITYELQYRPLEGAGVLSTIWQKVEGVTFDATSKTLKNFHPTISSEYRLKVTGTSQYSGNATTAYSEEVIVIRKTYTLSEGELQAMWNEDFGRFSNASTYITSEGETFSGSMTDDAGNTYKVEYNWAPDLHNYVKQHEYATESYIYKNYSSSNADYNWLKNKHRLEDGYYIITTNPTNGDNNKDNTDYHNAPDHTGNSNGGMLFVNVKDGLEGVLIYERPVDFNCQLSSAGITMLFTSYINNASYNATTPVNLRWELCEIEGRDTTTVYTIASGDVKNRSDFESQWANMSFRFTAKSQHYILRLYNNAPGGANWGNDIVVDDISVKLSYPTIAVAVDREPSCLGGTIVISASSPEGDFSKYFSDPKFAYLYNNAGTNGKWMTYNISNSKDQSIGISETMMGVTYYRVVVAPDQTILDNIVNAIVNGTTLPTRDCANIYAISDSIKATHSKQFDSQIAKESLAIREFCQKTEQELTVTVENNFSFAAPSMYYWYYKKLGDGAVTPIDSTTTTSHTYSTADNLFSEPGKYLLYVRAVDSLCQTSNAEGAKDWNDVYDTITVVPRNQLSLSLADETQTKVKYLSPVTFNVDNGGYIGDTIVWKNNFNDPEEYRNNNTTSPFTDEFVPSEHVGTICYHIEAPAEYVCVDKSSEVCVEMDFGIIPNLITPTDDPLGIQANNYFLLDSETKEPTIPGVHVKVFNRYQQTIYDGENGWDGTYRGETAEPGTYYFIVTLNGELLKKGYLEVGKFNSK